MCTDVHSFVSIFPICDCFQFTGIFKWKTTSIAWRFSRLEKNRAKKNRLSLHIILSAVHAMHWYDDDDDDMILSSIDLQSLFGINHSHPLSGLAVITEQLQN